MPYSACLAICWIFLALRPCSASFVPFVRDGKDEPGTFENPGSRSRPRFRYWLPDASVNGSIVAADIKSAGSIGAGGVEFLPFFNYGGDHGAQPKGANWSSFAFGSPAYRDLLVDALKSHNESNLYMDVAIGPNQGQGVPANADDEGLQWDLIPYTAHVPSNGSFNDLIPGWDEEDIEPFAVISAQVLSERQGFKTSQGFDGVRNVSWPEYTIRFDTLKDITSNIDLTTGRLHNTTLASRVDGLRIFSFYQRLSGNRNVHFDSHRQENIFDNGSFAVDHNSARGAQTVIEFWEDHILDDEVLELIRSAGNYMWEDSIEVIANITWSPTLSKRFEERFGYTLLPYLPLLSWGHNNLAMQKSDPGKFRVLLDATHEGQGFLNDFRLILAEGYIDYLQTLRDWANNRLGIQFSTQPSYGFPMDMAVSVPIPDAPECESLSFVDSIDAYRQFAGPAQLAGKQVISNEVGAVPLKAYSYDHSELLWSVNRAFAGGINQFIIHGQSYSGNYFGTTWPGYTAFLYLFSELYMDKQPSWINGFEDVLNYIARVQFIQRQGKPSIDVAVLNKQSANDNAFLPIYPDNDLHSEGWTYSYLTDLNLDLAQAMVKDGVLAPDGPAWKAFVVEATQNITMNTVIRLRKIALAGLPVIIAGNPGFYPGGSNCSQACLQCELSALREEANVYSVDRGQVARKLNDLGLTPQISSSNPSWHTTWRTDEVSGNDYAFLLNDGPASSGKATFTTTKKPFILDPWTGERTALASYVLDDSTITISLDFAANQVKLFVFEASAHECHLTSSSSSTLAIRSANSSLLVHSRSTRNVTLSSGEKEVLVSAADPFTLSNWNLTVSHWEHPSDIYDVEGVGAKRNTTHYLSSSVLPSWAEIPGLEDVSGVGYYTTSFPWSFSNGSSGAYISFPSVAHALIILVNGKRIPSPDHRAPMLHVTPYLRQGENEVLAIVPSTMWNYLRTIMTDLRSGGEQSSLITRLGGHLAPRVDNGIIGKVEVIPYVDIEIKC